MSANNPQLQEIARPIWDELVRTEGAENVANADWDFQTFCEEIALSIRAGCAA